MKQTRNRQPKPKLALSGATLAYWQSTPQLVTWAQQEPRMREVLTVLINERNRAHLYHPADTEALRAGRVIGYEIAVSVVEALAQGAAPAPAPPPEPTYTQDNESQDYVTESQI